MCHKKANGLIAMINGGVVTAEQVVSMCLSVMSDEDVTAMLDKYMVNDQFYDDAAICKACDGDGSQCGACNGAAALQ